MAGICENCGQVSESLHTCGFCGATVCSECKTGQGCKLCVGGIRTEDEGSQSF
jgi:hypothetical protein